MELGDREVKAHLGHPIDRPRGQTIATGLVAWILLLLHQGDLMAVPGEPVGGRRTPGTTADNKNRFSDIGSKGYLGVRRSFLTPGRHELCRFGRVEGECSNERNA